MFGLSGCSAPIPIRERHDVPSLDIDPPNIVFMMVDDLGAEALSVYGGETFSTPNIDTLASRGMAFNYAYATPICTTTRAELLTGLYPFHSGWDRVQNDMPLKKAQRGLQTDFTIPIMLKQAGYYSAAIGKWHLANLALHPDHPHQLGFDDYLLVEGPDLNTDEQDFDYWDTAIWQNGNKIDANGKFSPDLFNEAVLSFLDQHKDDKFFLYYPLRFIHTPLVSPPSPLNTGDNFTDMVMYMDQLIGNVVDKLDQLSLFDNTLILFTADNGTLRGIESSYHGKIIKGGKGRLSETGTRVPLIATFGNRITAGARSDTLVDFADMLPTMAHVAGISNPKLDGLSFAHHLMNVQGPERDWAYVRYYDNWIIHNRQWRLKNNGKFFDLTSRYNPTEVTEFNETASNAKSQLQRWADALHNS